MNRGVALIHLFLTSVFWQVFGHDHGPVASRYPAHTVYQFGQGYWLEELAARPNGQLLATTYLPNAGLWLIDPNDDARYPAVLVHQFENSTSALGIVRAPESEPDTYYVGTLNFSASQGFVPHTSQLWRVDMSTFDYSSETGQVSRDAEVRHVATLSAVAMANGMTFTDQKSPEILVADSLRGAIWKVDTVSGHYEMVSDHPAMRSDNPARRSLGIDAIKIHNDVLYFNNAGEFTLSKMPIKKDGSAAGEPEVIAENLYSDGFCLYNSTTVLTTMNIENGLAAIDLETHRRWMVAGNTTDGVFVTPTSVVPGRGKGEGRWFYVSMGGTYTASEANSPVGGSLVAVDMGETLMQSPSSWQVQEGTAPRMDL